MPKYSRTEDGEIVEHFDSIEELEAHERAPVRQGSFLGAFLLLMASSALVYFLFQKFGLGDAEKWVKASVISVVVIPSCIVGFKYGDYILAAIFLVLTVVVVVAVGAFLWSLL